MILICPSCATRYYAADHTIGVEGRNVRCATCGHGWFAKLGGAAEESRIPADLETERGPVKVFLSYSSKDRKKAKQVRDALVEGGFEVFWDQETPVGVNWDAWIRRELSNAQIVLVLWTKNSATSDNVYHEATIGRAKLIPATLEAMSAIDFPMGFYTSQAAPLERWNGKASHPGFQRLVTAINEKLRVQ